MTARPTRISPELVEVYCRFHELGFAHSVETWMDADLGGGVYGVAIGRLFAGESLFSRCSDASKVALVRLVERLSRNGFNLFDVQLTTERLKRFGAVQVQAIARLGPDAQCAILVMMQGSILCLWIRFYTGRKAC